MNSKICALLALVALVSPVEAEESQYEQNMKDFVRRLPVPLEYPETVFDWWPLDREPTYTYKVAGGRWQHNRESVGTVFTLDIQQAKKAKDVFHLKCKGFDYFPYRGLKVRENRVNLLVERRTRHQSHEMGETVDIVVVEEPFVVFPLFEDLVFYDPLTEYDFLKHVILRSTGALVYGPVSCGLLYVDRELAPSVYAVTQALHVPLNYTFKKGIGPIEWGIRGGYYVELVSHSLKRTDSAGEEAKSHQESSKK